MNETNTSHVDSFGGLMLTKSRSIMIALLLGLPLLGACEDTFTVPDLNNPGLEDLQSNPTKSAVVAAAQGLIHGARNAISNQTGFVAQVGILGRESLTFDNSDPRYIDEMLAGDLDPGNGAFGGSGWAPRYTNIRNANIVINALALLPSDAFTDAESDAVQGWAQTLQALDFLLIIDMRDENGAVIDVDRGVGDPPGPFETKEAVYAHIASLLDEAASHLQAGGDHFPFDLPASFAGFDTPETFLQFNRGLKARLNVYGGDYQQALQALDQSFITSATDLDLGAYYPFGTGTGDVTNGLFQGPDPQIVAHPSIRTDAETKTDGSLDDRVLRYTSLLEEPKVDARGVSSNVRIDRYASQSSPVPIIRNEELILLRAEARWFSGNHGGAMTDINAIRELSGGLASVSMPATDAAFVTELLKQRRYSLFMEGGHSWIDHRRFNRLGDLPLDRASDVVPSAFPVPRPECIARGQEPPCGA